ncbi:hypothetical protein BJ165DRAFT_1464618 [Panaeolus papilionaceus]|nr:hypothetical protein BJ165DRAFT_1464618 [Panaeolus papilionaceus]
MLLYMGVCWLSLSLMIQETTLVVGLLSWRGVRGVPGCSDTPHAFCSGNLNVLRCSSFVLAGCRCSGWSRKGRWLEWSCSWG